MVNFLTTPMNTSVFHPQGSQGRNQKPGSYKQETLTHLQSLIGGSEPLKKVFSQPESQPCNQFLSTASDLVSWTQRERMAGRLGGPKCVSSPLSSSQLFSPKLGSESVREDDG